MSLFITGTGTDVGKTLVTAGLAGLLKQAGESVCVFKPIQTGCPSGENPPDLETVKQLVGDDTLSTFCSYAFPEPLAPYAADPERTIRPRKILEDFKQLQASHKTILVEGAGGVRVPIARHFEMMDLIRMLQLPVVVVARPNLGTMNHTLLTVDALLAQRLDVKGVVISGGCAPGSTLTESPDRAVATLLETLDAFLSVPVLGVLPNFNVAPGMFHPSQADNLSFFSSLTNFSH